MSEVELLKTKNKKMKNQILTIALAFVGTIAMAQQSISWSHSGGLSPTNNITVDCDEVFEFISLAQTHPVAEGGLGTSTDPNFWANVGHTIPGGETISLSIPEAGTYYFRCGTNPAKQSLWGYITVAGSACESSTAVEGFENSVLNFYPNPVVDVLTITGNTDLLIIYDMNGKEVLRTKDSTIDVSKLKNGMYLIKSAALQATFIKK